MVWDLNGLLFINAMWFINFFSEKKNNASREELLNSLKRISKLISLAL